MICERSVDNRHVMDVAIAVVAVFEARKAATPTVAKSLFVVRSVLLKAAPSASLIKTIPSSSSSSRGYAWCNSP